jgi:hypothetical protein
MDPSPEMIGPKRTARSLSQIDLNPGRNVVPTPNPIGPTRERSPGRSPKPTGQSPAPNGGLSRRWIDRSHGLSVGLIPKPTGQSRALSAAPSHR